MTEWCVDIMFSGILLGVVAYAVVWGLHNLELFANTIMVWADKQETFFQKMISCEPCLTTQVSMALAAIHCMIFGGGLWSWLLLTAVTFVFGLSLNRKAGLLNEQQSAGRE